MKHCRTWILILVFILLTVPLSVFAQDEQPPVEPLIPVISVETLQAIDLADGGQLTLAAQYLAENGAPLALESLQGQAVGSLSTTETCGVNIGRFAGSGFRISGDTNGLFVVPEGEETSTPGLPASGPLDWSSPDAALLADQFNEFSGDSDRR